MSDSLAETEALAQADLCLLAARLLAPPGEFSASWPDASDVQHLVTRAEAPQLGELVAAACQTGSATNTVTLALEHARLFEGAVACPVNETAYIRRDKGAILADICGFHQAFGVEGAEECGEKPDHLVSELEFSAVLLVMLTHAMRDGAKAEAETTQAALLAFWRDHLMCWWSTFGRRLTEVTAHPFYAQVAALHLGLCKHLLNRYDVPESVDGDAMMTDEGTPYECGKAPQLVQLGQATRAPGRQA